MSADEGTIYMAGDADPIPGMANNRCDLALLPVGETCTLDGKEAAEAASMIQPNVTITVHFGSPLRASSDAKRFQELGGGHATILPPV